MLDELKLQKKVVGLKQCAKAVKNGEAICVYAASDASSHIIENVIRDCIEKNIKVINGYTMQQLGAACGIDVKAALIAVIK